MKQEQSDLAGERKQSTRHLHQMCLLPLLMTLVCAGCKQDAKMAGLPDPVGTYALVSVDGNTVPCTLQHEGHALPIKSGSFAVNADGTCSSKIFLSGRDSALEVKARSTRQGAKLTMQWEGAGMTTGTVEADTFTMTNEGMIFVYRNMHPR